MSYTLSKTGAQIDNILNRADTGGAIDQSIALKAPLASPSFTGTPTAPTPAEGDDSTQVATTAFVKSAAAAASYDLLVTDTAQGAIATFPDGADNVPVKSLIAQITPVQAGSGDPAPDNIRPISGWTGANITRCGKNLLDMSAVVAGAVDNTTGEVVPNTSNKVTPLIACKPSTTYAISGFTGFLRPKYYRADHSYIGQNADTTNTTFTTPADCAIMRIQGINSAWNSASDAQIEEGSTATTYEAYNGSTVNIDWTDEAGTVFKGNINVTMGLLTVTALELTMSKDDAWGYSSSTLTFYKNLSGDFVRKNYTEAFTGICDTFAPYDGVSTISSGNFVMFYTANAQGVRFSMPSANGDLPTFKAAIDGVKVIYPIVTPITYQLTPTEVKTLLGDNNIFVDTGNVDVQYRCDTALYIDKKLGQ